MSNEKENWDAESLIRWSARRFGEELTLACSFGAEDMALIDLWDRIAPPVRLFSLDTGRLHPETYQLMQTALDRYQIEAEILFPDASAVEQMVSERGINLFYRSLEDRLRCCRVRKVEPLQRALEGKSAWMTGLRRKQSSQRSQLAKLEKDSQGRWKISPLADWSDRQVWDYIRRHDVPYNRLHDRGFLSIGCAPCTRAVQANEDSRAGRWWWEQNSGKECGLHSPPTSAE